MRGSRKACCNGKPSKEFFTVLLCLRAKYKLDSGDGTQGLTVASLLLQPLCYLLQ